MTDKPNFTITQSPLAMIIMFIGLIGAEYAAFKYPSNNLIGERIIICLGWMIFGFEFGRLFHSKFGVDNDSR